MTTARPNLWQRMRARISDAASYRGWTLTANDGIIATAGLLQGFGGAGAGDRLLLYTGIAAAIAGGMSAGGAKWAEEAAEREAQVRLAAAEEAALAADPAGEIAELAALWEERGLSSATARTVAEELTAHDAVGAQLDAEYGIEEVMTPVAPIWSGVTGSLAFMLGAAVPLAITWLAPVAIETTAILLAVTASLILTSVIAARAGHLELWKVLARTLAVGLGTMGVSYLAGVAFF